MLCVHRVAHHMPTVHVTAQGKEGPSVPPRAAVPPQFPRGAGRARKLAGPSGHMPCTLSPHVDVMNCTNMYNTMVNVNALTVMQRALSLCAGAGARVRHAATRRHEHCYAWRAGRQHHANLHHCGCSVRSLDPAPACSSGHCMLAATPAPQPAEQCQQQRQQSPF